MGDLDLDAIEAAGHRGAVPSQRVTLALVAEVRRLRAENARLDAILWALNEHTPTIVDDEFGFRLLGRGCEHPSLTGDRCDACGWTQAWEADRG